MGLSSSAIAKSVARFEAHLGLRLFHRTTRRVTLTSDGRELYERCRHIVEQIEALRDHAEGGRAEPSGTLRLDMPFTYGKKVIVPLLAAFLSEPEQPELRLRIARAVHVAVVDHLRERIGLRTR